MTQQALYDTTTSLVLQWQDTNQFSYGAAPSTTSTLAVTATEWANQAGTWYVVSGALTQTNPNAPTAAQLLAQAQSAQTATLRQSYNRAIATAPVVVNGTDYTLATDAATQLSAYLSAQQALAYPAWAVNTAVTEGQIVTVSGTPLFCSTAGTTGSSAPTAPTEIGTPVADGTAVWELFARSVETSAGTFVWFTAAEIVSVSQQIELFLHSQKSTLIKLLAEVQAATTVSAVESITWP
jgi:hypothetical protein